VPNGAAGKDQTSATDYDAELRLHNEVLRRACRIHRHEHVLDIGSGTGQTTRDAARMAPAGSALEVDISAPAIERARELARAERLPNVTFDQGDAQIHPFLPGHCDLAFSRFGTMFFDDPIAAFADIGGPAPSRAPGDDGPNRSPSRSTRRGRITLAGTTSRPWSTAPRSRSARSCSGVRCDRTHRRTIRSALGA
jgi:hypothetical protein